MHGFEEWPLATDRWSMIGTVHPDPTIRSKFDPGGDPDPLEVVIAAEALIHRYCTLVSMLSRGDVEGWGVSATDGHLVLIPRSIWSHEDFYFMASKGDVLQENAQSTGRHDRLTQRWLAVVLQKPEPSTRRFREMFHGKPMANDELRSLTMELPQISNPVSKAIARVETKVTSLKACEAWLIEIIGKSPNERLFGRDDLWAQAQKKWPDTLSRRQFLAAREAAIRQTGAVAWAASGAPKKIAAPKSPR